MKINEIVTVYNVEFPKDQVIDLLKKTQQIGHLDNLAVHHATLNNDHILILTDNNNPAAYAGFISRKNNTIWQAKNAQTYDPYKGKNLVAKLYKFAMSQFDVSLQSDMEQTAQAKKLWTQTLPGIGVKPMILDVETEKYIDPATVDVDKFVYSNKRYCWIVESSGYYNEINMLRENSLLLQNNLGRWYIEEKEKE